MGIFKKGAKLAKEAMDKNNAKDPAQENINALYYLEKSQQKAELTIKVCTMQLKKYEKERKSFGQDRDVSDLERMEILKIKQAYYTLYAIRMTKTKITGVYTTGLLYDAKNDLSKAMHLINGVKYRTQKPTNLKYLLENKLLFGDIRNLKSGNIPGNSMVELGMVEGLYQSGELVDEFVNDELIEKLKKGGSPADLIDNYEGIELPFSEAIKCDTAPANEDWNILSADIDSMF